MHGFHRVASAVNKTVVANPQENAVEILKLLGQAYTEDVAIVVFPELTLTGYTASDLFLNQTLIQKQYDTLESLLAASKDIPTIAILGFALLHNNRLYNTAIVFQSGEILGVVPKSFLPNKKEFYDKRQFNTGIDIQNESINLFKQEVPFGTDLLFKGHDEILFGVEICEDLWAITPPSNQMAANGANIIFNLSASNELIGKAEYREELVRTQSARCMSAYVYSSSGVGESTTDTVFGGQALIAEYGSMLMQNERFNLDSNLITADLDLQRLNWLRINESSYTDTTMTPFRIIALKETVKIKKLKRFIPSMPFVPSVFQEKQHRCDEIVNIQAHALIKRMQHAHIKKAVIGISGGLDSTLALLSTHKAFELMKWNSKDI
ncbi:MAG: NAD synthetase (EC / Glutamine amidotransferase chain of NAD synthetase, partial [uncultured Sulfurovum sp.]